MVYLSPVTQDQPEFHRRIGEAIESYALVEAHQALLLQELLQIADTRSASAVLLAVPNVRARSELMQALFAIRHGDKFKEYWKSCTKYLDELSRFRNAIAHWHPVVSIYVRDGPAQETLSLKGLQDPKLRYDLILGTKDFPPFIEDCLFIRAEFIQLLEVLKENRLDTLPEKYQQPITRTNLAVID